MLLQKFYLYRAHIEQDSEVNVIYIISNNWASAFNTIYQQFGDNVNIKAVESVATENLTLFIDNNYVYNRATTFNSISITGIPKYSG